MKKYFYFLIMKRASKSISKNDPEKEIFINPDIYLLKINKYNKN